MDYIKVALPKGRIGELSLGMFELIGVDLKSVFDNSRKLVFTDEKNKIKFFMVKPSDVPTYVEYGSADIGIVGRDILLEDNKHLYEVLDLGFGKCKMVVAGPKELDGKLHTILNKRVATKFPRIAREYFEHQRHESIEIIKLNGSVELAPIVGLSEVIVDIVETGKTLLENGLVVMDVIADISARLVVNRVSLKMKSEKVDWIVDEFRKQLEAK